MLSGTSGGSFAILTIFVPVLTSSIPTMDVSPLSVCIPLARSSNGVLTASGWSQRIWCIPDVLVVYQHHRHFIFWQVYVVINPFMDILRWNSWAPWVKSTHDGVLSITHPIAHFSLYPPTTKHDALNVNTAHNFSYTETRYTLARTLHHDLLVLRLEADWSRDRPTSSAAP
jgi:hypothetical protein